jgi:hypothetical protein
LLGFRLEGCEQFLAGFDDSDLVSRKVTLGEEIVRYARAVDPAADDYVLVWLLADRCVTET